MQLTCPKCHGAMRQYERNGVTVDQCSECRGIFLDRGELERLVDAEAAWRNAPSGPPEYAPSGHHERHYPPQHYGYHKKRKSFFHELFDD